MEDGIDLVKWPFAAYLVRAANTDTLVIDGPLERAQWTEVYLTAADVAAADFTGPLRSPCLGVAEETVYFAKTRDAMGEQRMSLFDTATGHERITHQRAVVAVDVCASWTVYRLYVACDERQQTFSASHQISGEHDPAVFHRISEVLGI